MLIIQYIKSLKSWSDSHDLESELTRSFNDSDDHINLLCLYNERSILR